jgi:hypothetical protein
MSISEEEIFEYLKENLGLQIESDSKNVGGIGGYQENILEFKLTLKNPKTGKDETIIKREVSLPD